MIFKTLCLLVCNVNLETEYVRYITSKLFANFNKKKYYWYCTGHFNDPMGKNLCCNNLNFYGITSVHSSNYFKIVLVVNELWTFLHHIDLNEIHQGPRSICLNHRPILENTSKGLMWMEGDESNDVILHYNSQCVTSL